MGLCPSDTQSRERRACPHLSSTMKLAGGTSSIRYEVARKEGLSTSIRCVESSRRDIVCLVHSHANGLLVLVHPVRGLKHAGLHTSGTKSRKWRACPCLYGTRNKAGGTSSVRFEVSRKVCSSSSIWYEKSCKRDFVRLVRSRAKGEHVLVHPI